MGGEEETILVARRTSLRFDDVTEACNGDSHIADAEYPPLAPDRVEIEARHHECQVDVQTRTIGRADDDAPGDHSLGQKSIAGTIEWLAVDEQLQSGCFAGSPCGEDLGRIVREVEVPILGDEQRGARGCIVVGTGQTDHHESDTCPCERPNETLERIHRTQRTRIVLA